MTDWGITFYSHPSPPSARFYDSAPPQLITKPRTPDQLCGGVRQLSEPPATHHSSQAGESSGEGFEFQSTLQPTTE